MVAKVYVKIATINFTNKSKLKKVWSPVLTSTILKAVKIRDILTTCATNAVSLKGFTSIMQANAHIIRNQIISRGFVNLVTNKLLIQANRKIMKNNEFYKRLKRMI